MHRVLKSSSAPEHGHNSDQDEIGLSAALIPRFLQRRQAGGIPGSVAAPSLTHTCSSKSHNMSEPVMEVLTQSQAHHSTDKSEMS
jgi:hypothetical protein